MKIKYLQGTLLVSLASNSRHALSPVQSSLLRDGNSSQRAEQMSMVTKHFSYLSLILQVLRYSKIQLTFAGLTSSKTPGCQYSPAVRTLFFQSHQCPIKSCHFFPFSHVIKHTKQQSMRHMLYFCMLHARTLPCFFILPEFCTFI